MLKKLTLFAVLFAMFVLIANPVSAMLKVLDQEISDELRALAKEHIASSQNIDAGSITIEDSWLREFFNLKVEVYMINAVIDQGLSTEQKQPIYVRVDTKAILNESELALLTEEDNAQAPDEPVMRIMTAVEQPVEEAQPVAEDLELAEEASAYEQGGNMIFYIGAAILVVAVLAGGFIAVRRKA